MILYIPQNIDPYNTHLKNLVESYINKGLEVIVGYSPFVNENVLPDIIHFHHLEGILSFLAFDENLFFDRLENFRKKGTKILYTAHNIEPHLSIPKFNYFKFFEKFVPYLDLVIHHGNSSINLLIQKYNGLNAKRHIICHHGDYLNDMKDFHESIETARVKAGLPLNKKIILVFGQLQYKNPAFIKKVLEQIQKKCDNSILVLAGVNPIFKYNRLNKLYYKINNKFLNMFRSKKIMIYKRFSQFETYLLFRASDVVFLPHNSGLTSGIIPLAATLGKPFVFPDIGVFEEQAQFCFCEKFSVGNHEEAAKAIYAILVSGINSFDNTIWLKNNSWDKYVEIVLNNLD